MNQRILPFSPPLSHLICLCQQQKCVKSVLPDQNSLVCMSICLRIVSGMQAEATPVTPLLSHTKFCTHGKPWAECCRETAVGMGARSGEQVWSVTFAGKEPHHWRGLSQLWVSSWSENQQWQLMTWRKSHSLGGEGERRPRSALGGPPQVFLPWRTGEVEESEARREGRPSSSRPVLAESVWIRPQNDHHNSEHLSETICHTHRFKRLMSTIQLIPPRTLCGMFPLYRQRNEAQRA